MSYINDSLIAHYKLNDNAASATVADETGNHSGTYKDSGGNINTSTGALTGRINGALDFDGTDEYVEIADHANFTPALTPLSVSVWVYMHDSTSFSIASKGVYNTDGEWIFRVFSNDALEFIIFDESVADCYLSRYYSSAVTSYENQWTHLVATYDGGILSSGIKIYLNGERVDDTDNNNNGASFVSIENLAHAIWVGRYNTDYADGLIDNAMFFSVELTADDAKRIYNNGYGTEILAEMDEQRFLRRGVSPLGLRSRYEK